MIGLKSMISFRNPGFCERLGLTVEPAYSGTRLQWTPAYNGHFLVPTWVLYEVKFLGYNGHPLIMDTDLGPEGVHYKRVPL